jgi:hypothetical protein
MTPSWILGSEGVWFAVLNAVVVAIAILSGRARPRSQVGVGSPRRGGAGCGIARRASSELLQRLRSFSIFSYPSSCCLPFLQPDAASPDTHELLVTPPVINKLPSSRASLVLPSSPPPAAAEHEEEEEEGDPSAMSTDEAYALVVAGRQRPEHEREQEARQSEVDAKAEEFIQGFTDDLRQQRLNSIFNYTHMLKQRALGRGRR